MDEKINVLIVEDEAIVALSLEQTLEEEGYRVVDVASDGETALEIIKNKSVDLVLLDIQIPGKIDGIETARRIPAIKNIPFIYLTAFSGSEMIERAKETLPAAYLIKPYQTYNLLVAIELALYNFSKEQKDAGILKREIQPEDKKESILFFNGSIFIKQNYRFVKVLIEEIQFLEAEGNYTSVHTSRSKYAIRHGINMVLEKLMLPDFIRIHRSYAINVNYLTTFNNSIVVVGRHELPLGRNYKDGFFGRFNLL